MMMLGVVPGEEVLAESACVRQGAEVVWETGPVFQSFELALREGIVVGDMRAAVGLRDAQIGEHESHRLGGHRGSPVGVEGKLVGNDFILGAGFPFPTSLLF